MHIIHSAIISKFHLNLVFSVKVQQILFAHVTLLRIVMVVIWQYNICKQDHGIVYKTKNNKLGISL